MTPPPAYDISPEGLRIWVGGEVVAVFPPSYFGGVVLALVKAMQGRS